MATPIEQRGYAHPDALVSTDWVEQHLNDPKIRLIESNEDTLLYASGHVPGAVHVDWTSDLNDQIRRDYITRDRLRGADVENRRDQGYDGRLLRRQEQLVGVLRVLGVPAVRPHQRQGHGRRPREVAQGEPGDVARRPVVPGHPVQGGRSATMRRSARSAKTCSRISRSTGSSSTCAAQKSTPARGCTCPTIRTRGRCAAATSPARRASRGRRRSILTMARSRPPTS